MDVDAGRGYWLSLRLPQGLIKLSLIASISWTNYSTQTDRQTHIPRNEVLFRGNFNSTHLKAHTLNNPNPNPNQIRTRIRLRNAIGGTPERPNQVTLWELAGLALELNIDRINNLLYTTGATIRVKYSEQQRFKFATITPRNGGLNELHKLPCAGTECIRNRFIQ